MEWSRSRIERGGHGAPPHYSSCPRTTITGSMFPNNKPELPNSIQSPEISRSLCPRNFPHNIPGPLHISSYPVYNCWSYIRSYKLLIYLTRVDSSTSDCRTYERCHGGCWGRSPSSRHRTQENPEVAAGGLSVCRMSPMAVWWRRGVFVRPGLRIENSRGCPL